MLIMFYSVSMVVVWLFFDNFFNKVVDFDFEFWLFLLLIVRVIDCWFRDCEIDIMLEYNENWNEGMNKDVWFVVKVVVKFLLLCVKKFELFFFRVLWDWMSGVFLFGLNLFLVFFNRFCFFLICLFVKGMFLRIVINFGFFIIVVVDGVVLVIEIVFIFVFFLFIFWFEDCFF